MAGRAALDMGQCIHIAGTDRVTEEAISINVPSNKETANEHPARKQSLYRSKVNCVRSIEHVREERERNGMALQI